MITNVLISLLYLVHNYNLIPLSLLCPKNTKQRVYVYALVEGYPRRDQTIQEQSELRKQNGQNPPLLFIIDAREKTSASKK